MYYPVAAGESEISERIQGCLLLCFPNVLANQFVVDVVRTHSDFGGGEAGRLRGIARVRLLDRLNSGKRTFWILV